jgi:PKD repeat protein
MKHAGLALRIMAVAGLVAAGCSGNTPTTTTPPPPTAIPATPPPATTPPTLAGAPLTVSFAAFASGGSGSYEYRWDFGDGAFATNRAPSHRYESPGVFAAAARVTSGGETATCSRPITVARTPEPRRRLNVVMSGARPFAAFTGSGSTGHIDCTFPSRPADRCADAFNDGETVIVDLVASFPHGIVVSGCDGIIAHNNGLSCYVEMHSDREIVAARP